MARSAKLWLLYAMVTTVFWGIWGAFIEIPEKAGFPATLGYVVWSLSMIPCSLVALKIIRWKPETDQRSVVLGMVIGLLGAGGQLILFEALREGPAYIVFPLISLFPVLTIVLSVSFLKEKTNPPELGRHHPGAGCRGVFSQSPTCRQREPYKLLAPAHGHCIYYVGAAGLCYEIQQPDHEGGKHIYVYVH